MRRRFTDEFKQQAVRLGLDEGKSVTAVARELDLVASALGNWVKQAQAESIEGTHGSDVGRARGVDAVYGARFGSLRRSGAY